jgi:type IV fimbrial biogenesis protein FimT
MLKRSPLAARGFNLIELMITLTVLGLVLMIGLPNMGVWLQNTQIRNAAEGIQAGLQLARAEAVKRNTTVRFQLMDSLTASCAPSQTGKNWVISVFDASGGCDADASESGVMIIQKRAGSEGSPNATVFANGGAAVLFTGLGRAGVGSLTSIDVENDTNGECKTPGGNEPMRCLRITVSPGGSVRMCDPAVSETTDPRYCTP